MARQARDYTVELDFSDLCYSQPPAWGYFRVDAHEEADWDSQKLWNKFLLDKDAPQPVYFPIAFLDAKPEKIPHLTQARLDAVRVRDKNGKVVGGYEVK